ncbi:DUF1064 domain-containing protein [Sporomusa aerivorans]|uniref:DUF1064 domain-containing protein n=1 Tax=Sporomusa aerivorans TaxID=204936 RepID=UPI00352A2A0E
MSRMSVAQAKAKGYISEPKKHKYGAVKTIVDGIAFDSRKEAAKYQELKLLQRAGEIVELELQPEYVLQEAFVRDRKPIRAIVYRADFRAKYKDGRVVVMDTKGYRTKEYMLKKKMFLARYPDVEFVEC